jgi:hypothetical protein
MTQLNLMFVGSDFQFSALCFHQKCDNNGATIAIIKSDNNNIFGFFTNIPWQSNNSEKMVQGKSFFFKLIDTQEIVQIKQIN